MKSIAPGANRCRLVPHSVDARRTRPVIIVGATLVLLSVFHVNAETLDERLAPCLACHGEKGQSIIPEVPSLGGQPAFYLTVQLLMFREKLRVVEPMNQMLQGLKDDDLRSIAAQLAKLPPPEPAGGPMDANRTERGPGAH